MDILLTTAGHDLDLVNDDLVLVSGADCTAQVMKIRWLTLAGEWFLDDSLGVWNLTEDFRQKLTVARLAELRTRLEREALATPGVTACSVYSLDLNKATRRLSIQARATLDTGDAIDVVVDEAVA